MYSILSGDQPGHIDPLNDRQRFVPQRRGRGSHNDPRAFRHAQRRNSFGDQVNNEMRNNLRHSTGSMREPNPQMAGRDPRKTRNDPRQKPQHNFKDEKLNITTVKQSKKILEEPEDYIIASMTPSTEAYEKHSIGLKTNSSDAEKAYLEHKKKIMVSKYTKQLSSDNGESSGLETDDKLKSDVSDMDTTEILSKDKDNSATSSPSLPLKKRKYNYSDDSEKDSQISNDISADSNKGPPNTSQTELTEDEKLETDDPEESPLNRSMTPPPIPSLDESDDLFKESGREKERSSSLPLDDSDSKPTFKHVTEESRKRKKFRRRNDALDDG